MPVPFARHTTFAQLRDHLTFIGCTYGDLKVGFTRDRMVFFENGKVGGDIPPSAVVKWMPDDAPVPASQIRSICEQLEVDLDEFGFGYPP